MHYFADTYLRTKELEQPGTWASKTHVCSSGSLTVASNASKTRSTTAQWHSRPRRSSETLLLFGSGVSNRTAVVFIDYGLRLTVMISIAEIDITLHYVLLIVLKSFHIFNICII